MRSRERLIDVMQTVNPTLYPEARVFFDTFVRHSDANAGCRACRTNMKWLVDMHVSPHIRELAAEALHYLTGEQSHG